MPRCALTCQLMLCHLVMESQDTCSLALPVVPDTTRRDIMMCTSMRAELDRTPARAGVRRELRVIVGRGRHSSR